MIAAVAVRYADEWQQKVKPQTPELSFWTQSPEVPRNNDERRRYLFSGVFS
jgi:hypothetical protein